MYMKCFLVILLLFCGCLVAQAGDYEQIDYRNVKDGEKIIFDGTVWTTKIRRGNEDYFVKKISSGTSNFSEFYSPEGYLSFSTGCQYEFIKNGKLYGYSNGDLKFYEFTMKDGLLDQRELTVDEVTNLFPKFQIIKISEFSQHTNSFKIKKGRRAMRVLILNDTDRYFYHYGFTSNNAKFTKYYLNGLLKITKGGMIQFSHFGDNTKNNPWFILLVR